MTTISPDTVEKMAALHTAAQNFATALGAAVDKTMSFYGMLPPPGPFRRFFRAATGSTGPKTQVGMKTESDHITIGIYPPGAYYGKYGMSPPRVLICLPDTTRVNPQHRDRLDYPKDFDDTGIKTNAAITQIAGRIAQYLNFESGSGASSISIRENADKAVFIQDVLATLIQNPDANPRDLFEAPKGPAAGTMKPVVA